MIQRERFEAYQKNVHLGRILARLFGTAGTQLAQLEEVLELAIFQTAYNPHEVRKHMERAQRVAQKGREARLQDARVLSKVAQYDASEEPNEATFRNALRLPGVKNPWT